MASTWDCCPCCCCCRDSMPGPAAYKITRLMDQSPVGHRKRASSSPSWVFGTARRGARAWTLDTPSPQSYDPSLLAEGQDFDATRSSSEYYGYSSGARRRSFSLGTSGEQHRSSWSVCPHCQGAIHHQSPSTTSRRPRSQSFSAPGPGAYLGHRQWVSEASRGRLTHSLEGVEFGGRRRCPPAATFGTASRGMSRPGLRRCRCCGHTQWKM
mmetsp:Transcript_34984/g.81881  ORF Transcript_34984/g.81881 Transcript_34984/m.81881 type:complete len:211 (+) Transcript_34984:43-675(+)